MIPEIARAIAETAATPGSRRNGDGEMGTVFEDGEMGTVFEDGEMGTVVEDSKPVYISIQTEHSETCRFA
jgi:hypothetical protein